MNTQAIQSITRLRLSVFLERYFPDAESRPCINTIKNHIRANLLSGKKIGGAWYVECTAWGEPLYYTTEAANDGQPPIPTISTGDKRADEILKRFAR